MNAPAKFARRPRDRIKTDRRDALLLAGQTRAGELVKVAIPDARDEALRDLSRTREDASDVEGHHRADDPTAEQEGADQLEICCESNGLSVLKRACRLSVASVFPVSPALASQALNLATAGLSPDACVCAFTDP